MGNKIEELAIRLRRAEQDNVEALTRYSQSCDALEAARGSLRNAVDEEIELRLQAAEQ